MRPEWNTSTKQVVGVSLVLLGVWVIYISLDVFPILIIATLLAFLLTPVVDFFQERLNLGRGIAVILAYLLLFIIVFLLLLLLTGPMMQGFQVLADIDYPILVADFVSYLQATLISLRTIRDPLFQTKLDFSPLIDPTLDFLQNTDTTTFSASVLPPMSLIYDSAQSAIMLTFGVAASVAGTTLSFMVTFIVTLMCAIYMTKDGHKFPLYVLSHVPTLYQPEVAILLNRLKKTWQSYIRGQTTVMIIIGLAIGLGNWLLGVPGAFALGMIAGFMELVPYLGPILAAIPAVVIALIQGSTYFEVSNLNFAFIVIGFYLSIHYVDNTLVIPRVLGHAVKLHPLVVIIGVIVGASVAGILGALVATPIIASGREITWYLYAKTTSTDPYPPPAAVRPVSETSWLEQGRAWLQRRRA